MLKEKIKKLIPYCLILIAIIGFSFGFGENVANAQSAPLGLCTEIMGSPDKPNITYAACMALEKDGFVPKWRQNPSAPSPTPSPTPTPTPTPNPTPTPLPTPTPTPNPASTLGTCSILFTSYLAPEVVGRGVTEIKCKTDLFNQWNRTADFDRMNWVADSNDIAPVTGGQTPFEKVMARESCVGWTSLDIPWCFVAISNVIFHTVPAWILTQVAYFFNVIMKVSIDGSVYEQAFVSSAWAVVRDLSNIFFILILLYVAIEMILGIGHGGKKMIAQVIIMALLINFSMFFTKVIIDSSNVLAAVFYSKISVATQDRSGNVIPRPYDSVSGEKDVAGGLVSGFNPTRALSEDFFKQSQKVYVNGNLVQELDRPSASVMIGIILLTGIVLGVAIYALFVAGFSFLARVIELWILVIFSPFAFMSSTIPQLSGVPDVGWKAWLDRLIAAAFMAPIFMFFLYFIFLLISTNIFESIVKPTGRMDDAAGTVKMILSVVIPTAFICILLLKAAAYSKKASGQVRDMLMSGIKMAAAGTGLVAGGALLGGAMIGRQALGRGAAALSNTEGAVARQKAREGGKASYNKALERWERSGRIGRRPEEREHIERALSAAGGKANTLRARIGDRINLSQEKVGEILHGRHEWEDLKKKVGAEGRGDAFLSGTDKKNMEKEFAKSNRGEVESDIARGHDKKGKAVTLEVETAPGVITQVAGRTAFEKARQPVVSDSVRNDASAIANGDAREEGGVRILTAQGQAKVNRQISEEFATAQRTKAATVLTEKYKELEHESQTNITIKERVLAKSPGGSYDLRNLVEALKADKKAGWKEVVGMGLVGAVALGVRAGLKNGLGINAGTPQKDIWKDLSNVLTESLKNMKINIKIPESAKHDDHGGGHGTGGGDHGGGHH